MYLAVADIVLRSISVLIGLATLLWTIYWDKKKK